MHCYTPLAVSRRSVSDLALAPAALLAATWLDLHPDQWVPSSSFLRQSRPTERAFHRLLLNSRTLHCCEAFWL